MVWLFAFNGYRFDGMHDYEWGPMRPQGQQRLQFAKAAAWGPSGQQPPWWLREAPAEAVDVDADHIEQYEEAPPLLVAVPSESRKAVQQAAQARNQRIQNEDTDEEDDTGAALRNH